jgi:hypothetical protein
MSQSEKKFLNELLKGGKNFRTSSLFTMKLEAVRK